MAGSEGMEPNEVRWRTEYENDMVWMEFMDADGVKYCEIGKKTEGFLCFADEIIEMQRHVKRTKRKQKLMNFITSIRQGWDKWQDQ